MMDLIIQVRNLSKQYRIGAREHINKSFREAIVDTVMAPVRNFKNLRELNKFHDNHPNQNTIWALKDVSFDVQPGETVGVIGKNGAGKSTLFKILSRITEPSTGEIRLFGRVSSLLEVGTGFHPELSGRENIYLNGTILGMRKSEIDSKLDEIIAFSEIEKFLDTPVKRYSSGMYVRLAFAVAAHLQPDILIVDEVLAVGDATFQKKCIGKMGDVAHEGRTVLFVSHNMGAIQSLCQRVIWIDNGKIVGDGPATSIVSKYLNHGTSIIGQKAWHQGGQPCNNSIQIISICLKNALGMITSEVNISEEAIVEIDYEVIRQSARVIFSLVLMDNNGNCVFGSLSNMEENEYHGKPLPLGRYRSTCKIYKNLFNNGRYYISLTSLSDNWTDRLLLENVIAFDALDDGVLKRDYPGSYGGLVRPQLSWSTVNLPVN
jgi:lipopolysaccharide transport system ATP-binding protein